MKLNFRVILIGGLAFYVAQFAASMVLGPLVHEVMLNDLYIATASFWRPELNQDPPDLAALMPRWIATGLIASFIVTAIYDNIRSALTGPAWLNGFKYGCILWLFYVCVSAGWSGVFNLPETIWVWWSAEALVYYLVGGAVLGWVTAKLSPEA